MANKEDGEFHDLEETRPKTIHDQAFHRTSSSYSMHDINDGLEEDTNDPETTKLNVDSHIYILNCTGNITISNYYQSGFSGLEGAGCEAPTVRQSCHDREDTESMDDEPTECTIDDLETDGCSSDVIKCTQDEVYDESANCVAPRLLFVKGEAYHQALVRLEQTNVVFLVGGLSEGKTTTLNALTDYLEDYRVIRISHQMELALELEKLSVEEKLFAHCDDVFGKSYILNDRLKSWIENPSPALTDSLQSGRVKIGLTSTNRIWSKVKSNFENNKMFRSPVYLTWSCLDDREMLFQAYHCATGAKLSSNLWNVFSQIEDPLAFPYSCHQLLTGHVSELELQNESNLKQVIQNPLNKIDRQIEDLEKYSPNKYLSMVVLMLQGGTLMQSQLSDLVRTLEANEFIQDIWKDSISINVIETNLCSSGPNLIRVSTTSDKEYSFVDGFVFEAVARRFGKTHIRNFLENAKTELILDRCCVEIDVPESERPCYHIPVRKEEYGILARIMTDEVIKGNSLQVFTNPSVNVIGFQEAWLKYLNQLPTHIQVSFSNSNFVRYLSADIEVKLLWNYVLDRMPTTSQGHILCQSIYSAADTGELVLLDMFRKRGINLDTPGDKGQTPSRMATIRGKASTLSSLLQFGADPHLQETKNQRTLLHLAATTNHKDVVDVLLTHLSRVNKPDINTFYPLHLAAEKGSLEIIKRLFVHGADIDVQNRWGKTPLHYAVNSGHVASVKYLLDHGADVHLEDFNQQTALHFAAIRKDPTMMSFLLDKSADALVKDVWGKSAKEYAIKNRSWDLIGLVDIGDTICGSWLI